MVEVTAALHAVRASTADLDKGLAQWQWSDEDVRVDSLCEGWSRGHVLAHLARNADAIAATLSGALRGEIVARYPAGRAGREADIQAGAGRPVVALLADVSESAERLDRVFAAVDEAGVWDAPSDGGVLAGEWTLRRLSEVEIHRVDLAGPYGPDRWPPLLVAELLPPLLAELPADVRAVVSRDGSLVADLAGRSWGSGEQVVTGPDWALLAWLTGRGRVVADVLDGAPAVAAWH